MMIRYQFFLIIFMFLVTLVCSKNTFYVKNEHDMYEPAMDPVSSTVIPIPIYKLDSEKYDSSEDAELYKNELNKLLTVNDIKTRKERILPTEKKFVKPTN